MSFKRFAAVLLSALLLLGVFPVSAFAAERTQSGMIDEKEPSVDSDFVSQHKDALDKLFTGYLNHDENINIYEYRIPKSELDAIFFASIGVYPEIFFVGRSCQAGLQDGYLYNILPNYTYSAEEVEVMLADFYSKADEYLAYVDDSMDDFTKALVLHDRLAINNYYSIWSADGTVYSSNYTFMVEGWGRCENYAECYAYLLAQVGIKSEIINSNEMKHEWMKIKLDGSDYYYNVDLTFDDGTYNGVARPDRASHSYFLLSDEEFQKTDPDTNRNQTHHDYEYINESDDAYDEYDNLHKLNNPFFYVNGELYTLYKSGGKGYIAVYDHTTDTFDNRLEINDMWSAGGDYYWNGNFSGIAEYDGLLYYNGENCVYTYDPETGENKKFLDNIFNDGNQLYSLYISGDTLMCYAAESPNVTVTAVELCNLQKSYKIRFNSGGGSGTMYTVRTTDTEVVLPECTFTGFGGKVFDGWTDENGSAFADKDTMNLTAGKYDYTLTANWIGYYDVNIAASEHGSVSVKDSNVREGSQVEITVNPDADYRLLSLVVTDADNQQVPVDENHTFTMPDSDATITAVFELDTYPINTDGNVRVYEGDTVVSEALPDTMLSIALGDDAQADEGKYFTGEFTLNGAPLNGSSFVMPAEGVAIAAVQALRETLTLDFTAASEYEITADAYLLINREYGDRITDDESGAKLLDIDSSGTPDIKLYFNGEKYRAQRLAAADADGSFEFAFAKNTDRYSSITVKLPIIGDADGNGELNVNDATFIQRLLVGLETDENGMIAAIADFNGDGKVSIRDVTLIQMHAAGII